jgi:hypothetical protein
MTEGRATFHFGVGDVKQCKPFGHKRFEGLTRLEDLCQIFPALWEADGPIDFEGNNWKLSDAYLGAERPYRPKVWVVGGGAKLIDIATSYSWPTQGDGRRGVADEAPIPVARVGLREGDAPADAQRAAVDLERAVARAQRLEEADLDLDRGEAHAGGEQRLHGAAGRRVKHRAQQAAVDHADRVVGRLVGRDPEQRLAIADGDELAADEAGDRRRRQTAVDDRLQELAAW